MDLKQTKKENDEFLPLKIIGVIIVLGVIGYFVFSNSSQNSGSSDSIQPVVSTTQDSNNNSVPTTPPTTLSNTEMCKKHAQLVADSDSTSNPTNPLYYSVQSYHYSTIDNVCYFELHYQMDITYQGNKYTSQVYQLEAESMSQMKAYPDSGLFFQEASCNVPETNYYGATTNCKYYGLIFSTQNGYTFISNKYALSGNNTPPMSYTDYEALVQKRMNN